MYDRLLANFLRTLASNFAGEGSTEPARNNPLYTILHSTSAGVGGTADAADASLTGSLGVRPTLGERCRGRKTFRKKSVPAVSFGALHGVSLSGCRASSQHQEVRRRAEGRLQDGGRE
jgi:hypothetical protein